MSIISDALKKAQTRQPKKNDPEDMSNASDAEVLTMLESTTKTATRSPGRPILLIGIILAFLLIGGVFFLMQMFRSLKPAQSKPVTTRATAPAIAKPITAPSRTKRNDIVKRITPKASAPIIKKEEAVPEQKKEEAVYYPPETPADMPVLSGIMYSPTNPQAILDGNMVGEGEKVGFFTVQKIFPDKIKLTAGTEEYELKLR
jgi:hypothetical protein